MIKKLAVVLVLCFTFQMTAFASSGFTDVQDHWAKQYIDEMAKKGVVNLTDGSFDPDMEVTLYQFVAMLMEYKFGKQGAGDPGYIELALENEIIAESDLDNAGEVIPRLTAVRFCHWALLNILDEEDEENASAAARDLNDFNSCHMCREHVSQLYAKGIITGRPGFVFDGDSGLTKAEACTLVIRAFHPSLRAEPLAPDSNDVLISPDSVLYILQTDEKALLVDVRSQEEHAGGYIPGSICIPLNELIESDAEQLPDKNIVIIVYCQAGSRSQQAYEFLLELGYLYVYNMGGVVNWPYDLETR